MDYGVVVGLGVVGGVVVTRYTVTVAITVTGCAASGGDTAGLGIKNRYVI
jgi:hypothetical protein